MACAVCPRSTRAATHCSAARAWSLGRIAEIEARSSIATLLNPEEAFHRRTRRVAIRYCCRESGNLKRKTAPPPILFSAHISPL